MKIATFPNSVALNGKEVLDAFTTSLINDNHEIVQNSMDADVAVIWSVLWNGRMLPNKQVWDHYRAQNKPVIVLEVGGLKRNETWKIGLNGMNRDGDFGNQNSDSDRWDTLGLKISPWKTGGDDGAVIICGQHGASEQWKHNKPVQEWMIDVARDIRKCSSRRIVFRPHPRFPVKPDYIAEFMNTMIVNPMKISDTYDNYDFTNALRGAWAVVSYSSNPATEAVLAGVPVFVSEHSMCWDVGNNVNDLSTIENPERPDRTQWCNDIAYSEWTIQEIKDGIPWDRLKSFIQTSTS